MGREKQFAEERQLNIFLCASVVQIAFCFFRGYVVI